MKPLLIVCFALLMANGFAQIESEYQPMVAFKCNYPAMYLTEKGWIKDDESDCVDDVEDVLEYCRKMFPTRDVRNVVESGQMYTISSWCNVGETNCDQSFTVRPYRCLVGPFQSDALLVPAGCTFDHEHRSHDCKTFAEWNTTAVQRCTQQDRVAQSFAVLQPCEDTVSRFDGVEFVCCPKDSRTEPENKVEKIEPPAESSASSVEEPEVNSQQISTDSNNAYYSYVHSMQDPKDLKEEHAQFAQAKKELQRQHRAAVSLLEEDWRRVSDRVQRMKETDPQGAEKLEREATARFQKTSKALEDDGHSDKRQLDAIHQLRVDTILASLRSEALDLYHQALHEQTQDTEKILNTLQRYIRREQKERQHVENRFHHLMQSDPDQLAVEKHQMAVRLRTISQRIKEAVDQLDEVTEDQQKLRQQIDDFMQTFSELDRSAAIILNEDSELEPEASISVNAPSNGDDMSSSSDQDSDAEPAIPTSVNQPAEQPVGIEVQPEAETNSEDEPKLTDGSVDDQSSDTKSEEEVATNQQNVSEEQQPAVAVTNENESLSDESDDDDNESDAEEVVTNNNGEGVDTPQVKHDGDFFNNDEIELSEAKPFRRSEHEARHMSAGAVIGTVGGCMAIVALVIAAVIMLHRRINQAPRNGPAFSSVPQSMSPEDHHIVSMQMTGYENPTYRYFEDGGSSKA